MSEASASSTTTSSGSAKPGSAPAAPFSILLITPRADVAATLIAHIDPAWAEVQVTPGGPWPDGADPDMVLVDVLPDDPESMEHALALMARLRDGPIPVLALDSRQLSRRHRIALYKAGVLAFLAPDEDIDEIAARLTSLMNAKRTTSAALRRLREHTRHLDEQLRLAQRLQLDFLPRRMPDVAGGRFAARLEAAAWVAGDFYDIFRLDERHLGFYVADAVGHGIPAALLTVFVKKSLQTKRIDGKKYELIAPEDALALLNTDLLSAELQETPFITMIYGVYNEASRECAYARAGHPQPLLIGPEGSLDTLAGDGPLLGIFPNATFEPCRRILEPGERLLLYTDGAERVESDRRADPAKLMDVIRSSTLLPIEAMLDAILDAVHNATGGDHLADDVTLLALELAHGEAAC
jgi:sigma-B regulation protein RsbU (phosphoserine phosphatase)